MTNRLFKPTQAYREAAGTFPNPSGMTAALVEFLEELIEFNIMEAREAEHTAYIAGAHYTYLDKMRAHRYATSDLEHLHRSLLFYSESSRRLRVLRERVELEMNEKYPENAPRDDDAK